MSSLVIPLDMSQIPEEERKQLKVKVAVDDGEKITSAGRQSRPEGRGQAGGRRQAPADRGHRLRQRLGRGSVSIADHQRPGIAPPMAGQADADASTDCHHAALVAAVVTVVPRLRHQRARGLRRWQPCTGRRSAGLRCGLLLVVVVHPTGGTRRGDRRRRTLHHQVPLVLRLVAVVVVAAAAVAAR